MSTILQVGNFSVSHCSEVHWARTLTDMGHTVVTVQENEADYDDVMDAGSVVDLIIVTRCWGWGPAEWLAPLIQEAGDRNIPTAGLHLDRMWGLERGGYRTLEDPMWTCDYVFTPDGDNDRLFRDAGINHRFLPPGVLKDECYLAEPKPDEWPFDIAFVGSRGYHPEWDHRHQLIDFLRGRYGERFIHVGPDGQRLTTRGHDLNVLYASVKVIVGDSCFANKDGRYWSDRFPETYGRGGFLIFPRIDALRDYFAPYPMWDVGDWDGLERTINIWLACDQRDRDDFRANAHDLTRESHTYTNRMAELLDVVGVT